MKNGFPAILLFVFSLFTPSLSFSGTLYKWVDKNGVVHFTDNPAKIPINEIEKTETRNLPDHKAGEINTPKKQSQSSGKTFKKIPLKFDFIDWKNGIPGYKYSFKKAEKEDKPLILYFYTDWCKYCDKLNKDYLATSKVRSFLNDIPKVRINPEKGAAEKVLFSKYNGTGYPTFLVLIPSFNNQPEKIHPFRKGADWTISKYLRAIKGSLTRQYDKNGYSRLQNKQYEDAVKYFEMSLHFDSKAAYPYYGIGNIYQMIGYRENNWKLLKIAEENYLKSLEIEPGYKNSKVSLKRLRENLKKNRSR